jgi:cyclopropane fatty-acyl-phospholipid synthase-like methyltransferase
MAHDTERAVEGLRELARVTSLSDLTDDEFYALPPAEKRAAYKISLAKWAEKFHQLLDRAIAENHEGIIRICRKELAAIAAAQRSLDKIADAGG